MGLAKNQMGGGFSAGQLRALHGSVDSSVTAAGTVITDAFDLTADLSIVDSCASGAGVQLYDGIIGDSQEVFNNTVTQCLVYPPIATSGINQIPVGSGMILPAKTSCWFRKVSTTQIVAYMSA